MLTEEEQKQLEMMEEETQEEEAQEQQDVGEEESEEVGEEESEEVGEEESEEVNGEQKVKMVPHQAFHEEREKRKALRSELEQERIKMARLEERLNVLTEKFSPKEEEPDPELDPIGYQSGQIEKFQKVINEQGQTLNQLMLKQRLEAAERDFAKNNTDYYDALNHLMETIVASSEEIGMSRDEGVQKYLNEVNGVIERALQNGKDPAEMAYKVAKRYGFKSSLDETRNQSSEQLKRVATGQSKSKSLSSGSGKTTAPLSVESIANMSDEEFASLTDEQWKAAFGG